MPDLSGKVLDLGCGYGAIGISLAKLNPNAHITMVDINEQAVELAVRNIEQNQIKNAAAFVSDGYQQIYDRFHTIVSNPPIRAGKKLSIPCLNKARISLFQAAACTWLFRRNKGLNLQLTN